MLLWKKARVFQKVSALQQGGPVDNDEGSRRSSGGTLTSFYLRDFCPQADRLREVGPLVAGRGKVVISSSSQVSCS